MSEDQIVDKPSAEEKKSEFYLSSQDQERILNRVSEIKAKLIIDVPLTLPIIKIKTILRYTPNAYGATNGRTLWVNPVDWNALPNNQAEGVIYHEWCHLGLRHPQRMHTRIHKIFNYACDFLINYHIKHDMNELKIALAPGMLYDSYYNHTWFVEKIYEDLLNEVTQRKNKAEESLSNNDIQNLLPNFAPPKKQEQEQGQDQLPKPTGLCNREQAIRALAFEEFCSDIMANDLMLPPIDECGTQDKEFIREIIKAAEFHKKSKGNLPAFYEKNITKLRRARVPWERVFHDLFMELVSGSEDRSFARPKRWAMPYDLFLPSETGFQKQDVVLIIDSSGSMCNNKIFERFVGEVKKILQFVNKLTLIGADAIVHEKVNIDAISDLIGNSKKFHFKGGGGTDFRPALQAAAKLRGDIVIYYTDGYGTYGTCPPGLHRLLWILTDSECPKPPFGKYLIAEG